MELKSYQKKVIADLTRYLELLNETKNYEAAFRFFWQEKSAPTLGYYQDILPGVPNLCFKVPTGGGKTFIACNAIRPIFDALPVTKTKSVVWLVPSDAILAQTVKALKDTQHPYRQKIDVDFGGRVEVYTKQELLNGQNFNPTAVTEQLSIMVLSYDSFRGRGKEGLKAYQENSNLAEFAKVLGKPDSPIEKADETALFQIINQLNPLVIVDEPSCHLCPERGNAGELQSLLCSGFDRYAEKGEQYYLLCGRGAAQGREHGQAACDRLQPGQSIRCAD